MNSINSIALVFIIYQVNPITCQPFCGFKDPDLNETSPQRLGADFEHPVRYLRVFLVADYELYTKWFNRSEDKLNNYLDKIIRDSNELYKQLNVHLMVVGRVVETDKAHLAKETTMNKQLDTMNSYTETKYGGKDYESLLYFTGYWFEGVTTGVAYWTMVCTDLRAVLIRYLRSPTLAFNAKQVTNIAVHEMGHTLGMLHDKDGCDCPEECCIMLDSVCPARSHHWSSCSRDYLETYAVVTTDSCYQRPDTSLSVVPICGNGLVEAGEECDCHHHDTTCHACCDICRLTQSTCLTTLPPKLKKSFWTRKRTFWAVVIVVTLVSGLLMFLWENRKSRARALAASAQPDAGAGGGQIQMEPLGQPSLGPQGQSPAQAASSSAGQNGNQQSPVAVNQGGQEPGPSPATSPVEQNGGAQSPAADSNTEQESTWL
ncbi:Zinc metalloproteinase-disintegrin-like lachestatin-1 [Halotydeus destructor]|nr:Zinc metalloproteinase-disintegrin-like lachestatin-1 [Halotydeus destructor]